MPGKAYSVRERLDALESADDEIDIDGNGAVLERGCVYVIPLIEHLNLPDSISAIANPKSSTGRLDIFARLITDKSDMFDRVARGYEGRLYVEVSPRSFSVRVHKGSKLNQIRFRRLNSQQLERTDFSIEDKDLRDRHKNMPLVDHALELRRNGLVLRVGLSAEPIDGVIGYRAQKHADILDVDRAGAYRVADYWDPVRARPDKRLILDPDEFYILASRERLQIPPISPPKWFQSTPPWANSGCITRAFSILASAGARTIIPAPARFSKSAATKFHSSSRMAR